MQRRWTQQAGNAFLLALALCVFAACSSGTSSTSVTTPTPTRGVTPTPTLPPVPSHPVNFLTQDHVQLAGLLYGQGKTAVICSHELRTTKAIWDGSEIVRQLVSHGYQVLAYDFRGNGDSAGQPDTSLLDVDLRAAIAFMRQHGATKIVLLGSSMGGTATLKVAAGESVDALITLSAPQNFGPGLTDADVQAIKAPKLFVNSQDDDYTSDTQHMYSLAASPKEIHLYSGAEHGTSIFDTQDDTDLTQRILTFTMRYAPASS